ncbi:MAG TPA: hypothetical protein VFS63_12445 [Pseudolabrys sp.]|nr:hypothetical protein [Pseudolabrys sp.]
MPTVAPTAGTWMSRPLLAVIGAGVVLVASTLGLWAYYGTTVFFEVVRAGFAACF